MLLWMGMKASGFGYGAVVLGAWLSMGCGVMAAESAFEADFSCANAAAEDTNAAGRYRVTGCGRTATYVCLNNESLNFATPADSYFDTPIGKAEF